MLFADEGSRSEIANGNDVPLADIDWAFLDMLGDANDEFYSMNNDFRNFLGNGLEYGLDQLL